jgi:hypothetical protein
VPRINPEWPRVIDALRHREGVATHRQLRGLGLTGSAITYQIRPGGPWQRLLPGVVLAHRGVPTRRELLLGAVAFAGEGAVVSGADALRAAGAQGVGDSVTVLVLVRADRQKRSFGHVRLERTKRLPDAVVRDGVGFAPVPRAVIDLCRHQGSTSDVRALVAAAAQQRLCTVRELGVELSHAPRQRTADARKALDEVGDGVRSLAEARARDILKRSGLPMPLWNEQLRDGDGVPFLRPDAWWPEHRAALEIDSRRWHLRPEDWARTQRRQRLLTAHGIMVMAFPPSEILDSPDNFLREVRALLRAAKAR